MNSIRFKGEPLKGYSNYLKWLPNAKIFLETGGYIGFINEIEEYPKRNLYFNRKEVPKKDSKDSTEIEVTFEPISLEYLLKFVEATKEFERN